MLGTRRPLPDSDITAPPLRAKDNTKAEAAVLVVERWIPARLRHQTLFSPGELNSVIKDLLPALNQRR